MTLEEALFAHLTTSAGLIALVGDRVYPGHIPQGVTQPAIVYLKVSDPRGRTFGRAQFAKPRFQFSCWGETYASAKAVAHQVRAALENFAGMLGGAAGVEVRNAFFENELDLHDPETGLHHIPVDFSIWHIIPTT